MFGQLLQPEIKALVEERNFAVLKETFREWPPVDLAELIGELSQEEQVVVFRVLPHGLAATVFEYLEPPVAEGLLKAMGQEQAVQILNSMSPDDRTALLEELPSSVVQQLIRLLSPQERSVAQTLLGYPVDSVGRLMTPDYLTVRDDWTVQQVLDHIRRNGQDRETLNVIYVVDDLGRLVDDVRIREFLLRPLEAHVRDIRDSHYVALLPTDKQEAVVQVFKKYDRNTLPVVDAQGILLGIVTIDDVLDVAEQEATEDIQKFGGSEALEEPYLRIAVRHMVRKRAGWLVVLFVGEMMTATAMGFFENEIARAVVLALFVPLIISSGGNSGSQAATLIIRAMALGEVRLGDWWRVMRREVITGLSLGGILGVIGFIRIALWTAFSNVYGAHWVLVGLTVCVSLVGVVMWGSLAGSMLPFLLKRLGLDPAVSSAPFVATLVDVTGLVIYFSVSIAVLRGTLL